MAEQRKKKAPKAAGELVSGFLTRSGLEAHAVDLRLVRRWVLIVGPAFARNVRPAFSKGDTLHLEARTDAWAQETRNLDQTILEKIREAGAGDFKYTKVKTHRWPEKSAGRSNSNRKFPVPPPDSLPAEVEKRASRIEDTVLRDAIRSFLYYHDDKPDGASDE